MQSLMVLRCLPFVVKKKKKWAEKGYLLKSTSGRYANFTKVDNAKDYYVRLKYDGM